MTRVVAIPLTRTERDYLLRLLRREAEATDEPIAWDLLRMIENAVHPSLVPGLRPL